MIKVKTGYIYRYLHNGEVVYVGQTKHPLKQRVKQHCKEVAFLGLTHIQYIEIPLGEGTQHFFNNNRNLSATEEYYIHKYNPVLNIKKQEHLLVFTNNIKIVEENEWIDYTEKLPLEFPKFYDIFSK